MTFHVLCSKKTRLNRQNKGYVCKRETGEKDSEGLKKIGLKEAMCIKPSSLQPNLSIRSTDFF